ncbi:MAG TPA: cysteine--tRNA ligase [Nitrososphaerales archaeon]|nr:cysteine--tRNA ligase [Nitrososphaerales archaeon]
MLKLYNSLGRKVQDFHPIEDGVVKMYTCGPTVWNYTHVGNFRTFVFEDLLRRHLKFKGYKVTQVMNITDVEDRIIKGIKLSGKPLVELTSFYESAFHEDADKLGIERAERYPRATEHIEEMVALIHVLLEKKFAYRAGDGSVYFEVSKFKDYGALSGVRVDSLKAAGRVSSDHYEEKMEAADFALWKAWDPDDGEVYWETDLGKGRPGWSIECSAMAMKYLGETFDIHTGGVDNRFPHHENEIAQSEAATGKTFVRYWLHSDHLHLKGEEMHKSVGNVVNLRDLEKKGWDPLTVRLFLISARYRDPTDLTDSALEQAKSQRDRVQEFVARVREAEGVGTSTGVAKDFLRSFEESMDDDLNTPGAIAALFKLLKKVNSMIDTGSLSGEEAAEVLEAVRRANSVLGFIDLGEHELPPKLAALLRKREKARETRDFAESDRLRDLLLAEGVVLEDTPGGTKWRLRRTG